MEGHGRTPRGNRVSGWVVAQTCPPVCIRPDQSFGPDSTSTLLDHDRQKTTHCGHSRQSFIGQNLPVFRPRARNGQLAPPFDGHAHGQAREHRPHHPALDDLPPGPACQKHRDGASHDSN